MNFEAPKSLAEQIATHLTDEIISGKRPPGSRLQELIIANGLGVGRSSVREALLLLSRHHLVDLVPRKGAVVAYINSDDAVSCIDFYCGLLLQLAAKAVRLEKSVLHELVTTAIRDFDVARNEAPSCCQQFDVSLQFISELSGLVNNPYLTDAIESLQPLYRRFAHLVFETHQDLADELLQYFRDWMEALGDQNLDKVRTIITRHSEQQKLLIRRMF